MGDQPEAGGSGAGEGGQAVNSVGVFCFLGQWRIKDFSTDN